MRVTTRQRTDAGFAADAAASTSYERLLGRDPVLRRLSYVTGRPDPFSWDDDGRTGTSNFAALLLHIAGQQISTAVAFVLFDRMTDALGGIPDPTGVTSLGTQRLRSFGMSRAKAEYMVGLAESQLAGTIDVEHLEHLDDTQAVAALTSVRGIGVWSAEMFLIHQMHRPDVLPAGDLGIRRAVEAAWGLPGLPSIGDVRQRASVWTPDRSYAAAILWSSRRPTRPNHPEGEQT